ncbi:MAG: hypothetical protein IJ587_04000, partial [Synergistaceae bacterium]|nr:hypothetical protein [Synergistaceae bacterium]
VLGVGSSDSGPVWDFVLSGSAENLSLNICGVSSLLNHSAAFIDVSFKKATPSNSRTDEEMNELLNGTWQTERADSFNTNAGHIFVSSDETFVGEIEPPSDWPTVRGFIPVKSVFASLTLKSTDIADKSTVVTIHSLIASLPASGDVNMPVLVDGMRRIHEYQFEYPSQKFEHVFGGVVYKLTLSENDKYALLINGNEAYFVEACYMNASDGHKEIHTCFKLHKMPEESSLNIAEQIDTVWAAAKRAADGKELSAGYLYESDSFSRTEIEFRDVSILFPEPLADVRNATVSALFEADSRRRTMEDILLPDEDNEPSFKKISILYPSLKIKEVGYNTWYASASSGTDYFMITMLDENLAVMTGYLASGDENIEVAAVMQKSRSASDVFFEGAWICSSEDAKVSIIPSAPSSVNPEAKLLTFGAVFSDVNIDAETKTGTASFTAAGVLSNDIMLVPVFYDKMSVDVEQTSPSSWYAANNSGTLELNVEWISDDIPFHAKLSGTIDYSNLLGMKVSFDTTARKLVDGTVSARPLDFDSIMNHSTWYTISEGAFPSGGFINVYSGGVIKGMYPSRGGGLATMMNMIFEGTSADAEITGNGVMRTKMLSVDTEPRTFSGPSALLTLPPHTKIDLSRILGNMYRVGLETGIEKIKGVFILLNENTSFLNLQSETVLGNNRGSRHSVFYLHKDTEPDVTDISAFDESSWGCLMADGMIISGDISFPIKTSEDVSPL